MFKMSDAQKIAFLEYIIHSNTDPIIVKNWLGKFVFANQAVAKLYNTTPEQMIGYSDEHFTKNEEQGQFFLENVQRIMKAFKPELVYEDSTDAKTGEVRHFLSHKIPFLNPLNELNILVIAKDITDITRLKVNAEYNEKRLNFVLQTTKEGVWDWDITTNFIYHNHYWFELTGLEEHCSSFADYKNCIFPEDRRKVELALVECLENNRPYRATYRIKQVGGNVIWVFDRGEVVERDAEGKPTRMIGAAQDITQQKLDQEQIEKLAFYDPLTDLPNRRLLQEHINLAINQNKNTDTSSALMFLDFDNFKNLNDTCGHKVGDNLLVAVAQRLKFSLGEHHNIARFGGDEFVIIINNLDSDHHRAVKQVMAWSDKLHGCFEQTFTLNRDSISKQLLTPIDYQLTVSMGVTIFNGLHSIEPDELLKLADLALYRAKTEGRNRTVVFDPCMQEDLVKSQGILNDFSRAIKNNEFELFYQPQLDINNQLIGLEALLRWPQKDLQIYPSGYLSPYDFIPMAEETGLIIPLGNWVLSQACVQLKKWGSDPDLKNISVSINISAKQIAQADFIKEFFAIVDRHHIEPQRLKIEITESILLHDVTDTINKLQLIKERGIRISLDDFGTGYSSLSYLKRLPVDEIKIDQAFVRDIMTDESDAIMVKAIIDLSKNFGVDVIAEGVETDQQLHKLIGFGCFKFQGYLFSKPLNLSDLDCFVMNRAALALDNDEMH